MTLIKLVDAEKTYNMKSKKIRAIQKTSITFDTGKFYAIMGQSGSGKTTLIQILGLLDTLTSGKYYMITKMSIR